jgi:hypothetical protein
MIESGFHKKGPVKVKMKTMDLQENFAPQISKRDYESLNPALPGLSCPEEH